MCGIAGIHRRTEAPVRLMNKLADSLLLGISHRGSDATGFLSMADDGSTMIEKQTRPCVEFVLTRSKFPAATRTVLLHTRFATRGAADDPRNAHPVVAGKVAAIHNGTIYNDDALFRAFGMKRTAAVDSIVIPALVGKLGWSKASKALSKLRGGAATAVVHSDHPTEVILARTQSYPMHVLVTDEVVVWASERASIEAAWRYTYGSAPDGEWIALAEHSMLHVNGKIVASKLDRPKALPARPSKPWPLSKPKAKKAKAAPAKQSKQQLSIVAPDEHEPWMDQEVDDLMRWAKCSREEAYEAVYGTSMPDADLDRQQDFDDADDDGWAWIDDIIVTESVAQRRAEGWEVGL